MIWALFDTSSILWHNYLCSSIQVIFISKMPKNEKNTCVSSLHSFVCLLSQLILYILHLGHTMYLSNFHQPNATIWQRVNVTFAHLMVISRCTSVFTSHSPDKRESSPHFLSDVPNNRFLCSVKATELNCLSKWPKPVAGQHVGAILEIANAGHLNMESKMLPIEFNNHTQPPQTTSKP